MEISERRSSRTKTVKRLFEIETEGCSKMNNKPTSGVKMKGGAPSGTTTDFVTPKSIKRSSNGEVQTKKVMSALHNLGNTCFLNSVLQVLYHTPQFQDKITLLGSEVKSTMLALDLLQQLNYDGLDITHGIGWSLVSRLSELLKQMEKIDNDIAQGIVIRFPAIRPYNLLETIEEISPEFKGNQQQDAHELLKCVLMNIDEASNELNTSRSKLKLCIGNRSRESNLQEMVKNLDSNSEKLQTNALLFEANNHAACDVDLKNSSSVLCDDLKNELQEDEETGFRATDGCNLLTSDVLSGEKWTLYRGMKRKYGQFDCESDDHLRVDEEISMKLKPSRVADTGSQVSFIRLSPLSKSQLQQQIVQNCCIHLHRFDSPLGMHDANFATQAMSNLVTEMFQGMMSLKTKCLNCMKETERKEEFQDISLPIRKPTAVDSSNNSNAYSGDKSKRVTVLQLILSILDEVERLDGENCYYCESCQLLVTAERRLCYELLPNILTIHLKRFAMHSSSSFTKTFDRVDIPLELPCLESNCRSQGRPCHRYSLYGIVCHAGKSVVSGHYTSYVRVHPSGKKGSQCSSLSQSHDKRSPNVLSPDDGSVVNRMSGDMQRDSDTSLDTSGQAGDSVSLIGAQSSEGSSFTNGCVTMHDISLVSTSGSRSEPRNSVMPDLVSSSKEDPVGHSGSRKVGRPRKRKMRHSIQSIKCAEPEVNTSTSVSTETDLTSDCGDDSLWYKCNDDVITELTKQQLAALLKSSGNITPYMLFYHKVPLPTLGLH